MGGRAGAYGKCGGTRHVRGLEQRVPQHNKGHGGGAFTDGAAVAGEVQAGHRREGVSANPKVDGADGFLGGTAGGAGDAAYSNCGTDSEALAEAGQHFTHDGFAYRAMCLEGLLADPEQGVLPRVGVGDQGPVKPGRRAGDVGGGGGDEATGAGLGSSEVKAAGLEEAGDMVGGGKAIGRQGEFGEGLAELCLRGGQQVGSMLRVGEANGNAPRPGAVGNL